MPGEKTNQLVTDEKKTQVQSAKEDMKVSKEEAGFRKDGGTVNDRTCSNCVFYEDGTCDRVEGVITPEDICNLYEPLLSEGALSPELFSEVSKSLTRHNLFISRVSENPMTGERMWFAKASGVDWDKYHERMSRPLFKDFIARAESREIPPKPYASDFWNGGLPYLSVAHFLDFNGEAVAGITESIWIDGNIFKAKGKFTNNEFGEAVYRAVKADIDNNVPDDERVRISIAFLDYGHEHVGRGTFERKSLTDKCALCAEGVGGKTYQKGHLIHLAATRIPAYENTILDLEERSMTTKTEDAKTIVGAEGAKKLEELEANSMVNKSEAGTEALVIKSEDKDAAGMVGNATSIEEAEAYLQKHQPDVLMDGDAVLQGVLSAIARSDATEETKDQLITKALAENKSRVDVMAVGALANLPALIQEQLASALNVKSDASGKDEEDEDEEDEDMAKKDEEGYEEAASKAKSEADEFDTLIAPLRAAYDDAVNTPVTPQQRLEMLQPAFNEFGLSLRSAPEINGEAPLEAKTAANMTAEEIAAIVQKTVAEALGTAAPAPEVPVNTMPVRRAVVPNAQNAQPVQQVEVVERAKPLVDANGKPRKLTAKEAAQKSVGIPIG